MDEQPIEIPPSAQPARTLRRTLSLLLAALVIIAGLWLLEHGLPFQPGTAISANPDAPAPRIGAPATDFTLRTLDGRTLRLSSLKGQVVLVNFWATWCGPCRAEIPEIQAYWNEHRDQGFEVVAVDVKEDAATVQSFVDELGLKISPALDEQGTVTQSYRIVGLPTSFFIDRAGIIRDVHAGPMTRDFLERKAGALLRPA